MIHYFSELHVALAVVCYVLTVISFDLTGTFFFPGGITKLFKCARYYKFVKETDLGVTRASFDQ